MVKSMIFRKLILYLLKSDSKGILNSLIFRVYNERINAGPFAGMMMHQQSTHKNS